MFQMDKTFVVGCITFVLFIAIACGSVLYGHIYSTDKYNESMNKCIEVRGSWIPTYGFSGVCIVKDH